MNLIEQLQEQFYQFLTSQFSLPAEAINLCSFEINIDEQKNNHVFKALFPDCIIGKTIALF